jgi:2-oxoglutarate ferredoxin oxidoreductase, delta subunit (EC 1.2.7.3)
MWQKLFLMKSYVKVANCVFNACPKNIIEMDLSKINVKGYHPATVKPEIWTNV